MFSDTLLNTSKNEIVGILLLGVSNVITGRSSKITPLRIRYVPGSVTDFREVIVEVIVLAYRNSSKSLERLFYFFLKYVKQSLTTLLVHFLTILVQ